MNKEIEQLKNMGTYTLEKLLEGRKVVECHWVYTIKQDLNGKIQKYKVQLVAQGFLQILGQDFFNTYASVIHLESLCILLTFKAAFNMEIH